MQYDLIILLASQPDFKTWKFPAQIHDCIKKVKELLEEGKAPYVAVGGNRSVAIDNIGFKQKFRECDELAKLLVSAGVPPEKILKEGKSKDTISNLYYLKTEILLPRKMYRLLFVVADFRIPRLKFLCERILGSEYLCDFEPIKSMPRPGYDDPRTFQLQIEFLKQMKPGNHAWLADKFFTAPMYKQMAKNDRIKYADLIKKTN